MKALAATAITFIFSYLLESEKELKERPLDVFCFNAEMILNPRRN